MKYCSSSRRCSQSSTIFSVYKCSIRHERILGIKQGWCCNEMAGFWQHVQNSHISISLVSGKGHLAIFLGQTGTHSPWQWLSLLSTSEPPSAKTQPAQDPCAAALFPTVCYEHFPTHKEVGNPPFLPIALPTYGPGCFNSVPLTDTLKQTSDTHTLLS